ncbi:MAG TPA: hypothetical protein VFP06_06035, partial [Acidimicrobiales bacterium]|nr:hypothetical protein [Acidimicrobiales bacterium]
TPHTPTPPPWPQPTPPDRPAWLDTPPPAAAPPAAAGGLARRQPPDAEARRTPSGLVKRSPRVVDTGEIRAVGPGPNDELLASLSRYTTGIDPAVDRSSPHPPAAQPPVTPLPPALPSRHAPGPPPGTGPQPPAAPFGQPPTPFGQPPAPALPSRHAAVPQPPAAPPPAERRRQSGAGLGGLAAGLSGLTPFGGSPPSPQAGRGQAPPAGGGTTPAGLTRRVRGAQMPTASPLAIRRSGQQPDPGAAPPVQSPPAAAPPPRTPEQKQSADAVYSFLSNFTAGVQRGLDDARARRPQQ